MKQFDLACSQLEQKPFALSFHVPVFFLPDCWRASRVILPSGVKVILNFVRERLAVEECRLDVAWRHG